MHNKIFVQSALCLLFLALSPMAAVRTTPLIVDHTYDLTIVPDSVLAKVRNMTDVVHYAHRSDGSAVPFGLQALSALDSSRYPYAEGYTSVPTERSHGIRFWNGMVSSDYIYPADYWMSDAGRKNLATILTSNSKIRYTSWTFCNEDDYWGLTDQGGDNGSLGSYIRIMDYLEQQHPNVTFIYQTAAMRDAGSESSNVNQAIFNDSLRHWARLHNKVLFDFADLDVWYKGSAHTDTFRFTNALGVAKDTVVPFQNPGWLAGNGATNNGHHANDSMGVDKGKAWWYLMARLTGWNPTATSPTSTLHTTHLGRKSIAILQFKEGHLEVIHGQQRFDLRGHRLE